MDKWSFVPKKRMPKNEGGFGSIVFLLNVNGKKSVTGCILEVLFFLSLPTKFNIYLDVFPTICWACIHVATLNPSPLWPHPKPPLLFIQFYPTKLDHHHCFHHHHYAQRWHWYHDNPEASWFGQKLTWFLVWPQITCDLVFAMGRFTTTISHTVALLSSSISGTALISQFHLTSCHDGEWSY